MKVVTELASACSGEAVLRQIETGREVGFTRKRIKVVSVARAVSPVESSGKGLRYP